MESLGDKLRAYALAALVHLFVAALLFAGLFWTASTAKPTIAGPVIEAELVGLTAAPRPRATPRPQPPKPPEPKPEQPKPEPPKPPEPKPEPPTPPAPTRNDQIEREKIAEMAQQKAEQEKRAQEEKVRQEQILLEQQQERQRLKELEEIKRQREAADRKLKLEREKLAQLKDLQNKKPAPETPAQVPEAPVAKTGAAGKDTSLLAEYSAAIQNAVRQNWLRPESVQGVVCDVDIKQIVGGDILEAHVVNPCNADVQVRDTIEQAVRRAAPLPYKGYESVFRREIVFTFCYPQEVCPK